MPTPTPPLALPALPRAHSRVPVGDGAEDRFTADQMNAYATAAILSDRAGRGDAAPVAQPPATAEAGDAREQTVRRDLRGRLMRGQECPRHGIKDCLACIHRSSIEPQDLVVEASDDPYFSVQDEVCLTQAVCVMNDVLTDIEGWEDKELSKAVESSKVDLCAMIECIRMRADSSYIPGTKPIDGELATQPPAPQPDPECIGTQLAKHFFAQRWDEAALRKGTDQAVTPEFMKWLQTMARREGVASNEAWNAGVAWARAQAPAPVLQTEAVAVVGEASDDGMVAEFPVIALGHGLVEIGDATWEGLNALFFGRNGAAVGPIGTKRDRNNKAQDGETMALITFANLKGLEQVEDALSRVRRNMEASQGEAQ